MNSTVETLGPTKLTVTRNCQLLHYHDYPVRSNELLDTNLTLSFLNRKLFLLSPKKIDHRA